MNIVIIPENILVIDHEKYAPWPTFEAIGSQRLGGLWRTYFLKHALTIDDLTCAAWRASIPTEILKSLQQFPGCQAELIEMAQCVPEIFIRWAERNPALLLIAATYWRYRRANNIPTIETRRDIWENLGPREILHFTHCDTSVSFLKALGKVPLAQCDELVVARLREQWQFPEKRKVIRHLESITMETIWLLDCIPSILDPGIHRLASEQPYFDEFHIRYIIRDLISNRKMLGMDPWPYRNRIHSWEQLLAALDRFLRKTNHLPERFPSPPLAGVYNDKLHIEPIISRTALRIEASDMCNCVSGYEAPINRGEYYVYRLLSPERASVLINWHYGRWAINEAMIEANRRQVRSATWNLLNNWVKTAQN